MSNLFKRNDAEVQEDGKNLTLEAFLRKYASKAIDTVLTAAWKDIQKKNKQTTEKTDEANDLPQPAVIKSTSYIAEDGAQVVTKTLSNGVAVAEIDNEPGVDGSKKKKTKKDKGEATGETPAAKPVNAERPARATRLRELIAAKADKKTAIETLKTEGYDVKTIHSEWNRLSK